MARDRIADSRIMNINFYPRESHVVTFRDPCSFPVLFHPGCSHLIKNHLQELAQKVKHLVYACLWWNSELTFYPRSSHSVRVWVNIPSSGITGPEPLLMKPPFFPLTWRDLFKQS